MYYLIHEKECFIIFKTRGAAERFRYDKTRLCECIKVAPYGFDCVEHNHVQQFIIFSSCKVRSQNSAT